MNFLVFGSACLVLGEQHPSWTLFNCTNHLLNSKRIHGNPIRISTSYHSLHFQMQVLFPVIRRCIKALEGEFNHLSMDIHKCHRQHFKHALDDVWSIFSIKFSGFGSAFEEFLNKNFMAVLPARRVSSDLTANWRQHRAQVPFKAPTQAPYNRRRNNNVHPHRGHFLHIMAGTELFKL